MKRTPQIPGRLEVVLGGDPVAWARPRHDGRTGTWFEAKEPTAQRRKLAQLMTLVHGKRAHLDGRAHGGLKPTPVAVTLVLTFTRHKTWDRKTMDPAEAYLSPVKPDIDNCTKLVLDAAMDAGVLYDDGSVARLVVTKVWAARGAGAATSVLIESLSHGTVA